MTLFTPRKIAAGTMLIISMAAVAAMMVLPGMAMAHEGEPLPPVEPALTTVETTEGQPEESGSLLAPIGVGVVAVIGTASYMWLRSKKK